jgi:hypothetical protein
MFSIGLISGTKQWRNYGWANLGLGPPRIWSFLLYFLLDQPKNTQNLKKYSNNIAWPAQKFSCSSATVGECSTVERNTSLSVTKMVGQARLEGKQ